MNSPSSPTFNAASSELPIGRTGAARAAHAHERAQRFDEALRLLELGGWQASYARLTALADDGHPQAARIALLFAKNGARLFGGAFPASAAQREGWQRASD